MRESLILLVLLPVALLAVLNQRLEAFRPADAQPTPVVLRVAVPTPTATPTLTPAAPALLDLAGRAISFARTWLGVPYAWGGCSRGGIDCSCFVKTVLEAVGLRDVPRVTTAQVRWARPVPPDQLRPLDLVFFDDTCTGCGANPTHVGLAIGNGLMIQAGGAAVSIQPVFAGFYGQHFASAGRSPQL